MLTTLSLSLFSPLLPSARAEDASTTRARERFQEAVQLESQGAYADALTRFREVAAVRKTPTVLFHIALCLDRLGQSVEALETYRQASRSPDPMAADVKSAIEQNLSALDQRLPTLTLRRGKGARAATILLDGKRLDDVSEPFRLLPGKHLVQARAKNKDNFRQELVLAEGQRTTVEVILEDLGDDRPEPPPLSSSRDEPLPPPTTSRSPAPYLVLGVGAASLAASGVFFLLRNRAKDDLESQCAGNICPSSARSQGDRASTYNTLTNVTVSVGAVGVAAGVVWLLARSSSSPEPKAASLHLAPLASPGQLGAHLSGAF